MSLTTPPPYSLTHESVTLVVGGKPYTIQRGADNFDAVREAVIRERWDDAVHLISPGTHIEQWLGNGFTFVDNILSYEGEPLDSGLNDRLLNMAAAGSNPTGWLNFWARLQANPSYRSVHQLYAFIAHKHIPIDEKDGFILAYKSVRADYKDHHSGQFDNSPGNEHSMPRNKISDDPNTPCHEGFHVGALDYALSFGGPGSRIVICKVDPADVVCVPYDSSAMKVRVCRYSVIGNYAGPLPSTSYREETDEDFDAVEPDGSEIEEIEEEEEFDTDFEDEDDTEDEPEVIRPSALDYATLDTMSRTDLGVQSLAVLRKYAANHLKLIGASKIPGGKPALIDSIIKHRR